MAKGVNVEKLHRELKAAGLPVVGVASCGRVDYARSLTVSEREIAKQVINVHDPTASDSQVFIEKLKSSGLTRDDVLYALWRSVAEEDEFSKDRLIETLNKV